MTSKYVKILRVADVKKRKIKVLIVTPCGLPIPAVKGGAVLTLMESIIKENEINNAIELHMVGVYDEQAERVSKKYKNTQFQFIRIPKFAKMVDKGLDYVSKGILRTSRFIGKEYARKLYIIHRVRKLLNENEYDRVVFQNAGFLLNAMTPRKLEEKYKGKIYYHLHNDIPDNVPLNVVRQCKFILISEYLKKHIAEVCGQDMSEQCIVVRNGFDCDRFAQILSDSEKLELKRKLGIEADKKILMFAGRIAPTKGILELTEAFRKLDRDDTVLMVVGAHNFGTGQTSEFQKRMEKQFSELGKRVCFTGYVPYDEIWKYYKLADIAALPSTWEEPAGLTMIEACAAGVPLITTKSGGIPEYVNNKESVLLENNEDIIVELERAINEILNNIECWKKKAELAQKRVRNNYNVAAFYNEFYSALLRI